MTAVEHPSMQDASALVGALASDADEGLDSVEAARRLSLEGPNEIQSTPGPPRWRKMLEQFQDPLIYLLIVAVIVSIAAWAFEGASGVPVDAVVIAAIIIANGLIGYVQQARAADAVKALRSMTTVTSGVLRDGEAVRLPSSQLVSGDILVLAEGDSVGADARLLVAAALRTAESSLTGESEPVDKDSSPLDDLLPLGDRTNMIFKGTAVTQGSGRAIVTATGMDTEVGAIARLLDATVQETTPLQREIAFVGKVLGLGVVVIALVVMATIWVVSDVRTFADAVTVLLLGVSLAVAAVPEGMPAILSVVLSIGTQRMARRNAIVKRLSSVETLGSASVICSDKTGTLTRNEMTLQKVMTAAGSADVTGLGYAPLGEVRLHATPVLEGDLRAETIVVLSGGSLASNADLHQVGDKWQIMGDPTEAAFLVAERKLGVSDRRTRRFSRIGEVPFTSQRKIMSTIEIDHEHEGTPVLVSKGAPDVLLQRCTSLRTGTRIVPLTDEMRDRILADVETMSADALRTLSVAYRPLDWPELGLPAEGDPSASVDAETGARLERDLVFVGTVGIIDPPRTEVAAAVEEARRAGIRVLMITGDHPATASRVAQELGISVPGDAALTGPDIDALDGDQLSKAVATVQVYARVAPEHKLRIVQALRSAGNIVAMTGDGVNDAPALKSADIGVAMGVMGTDVTKEAADMVLADDDFATIVVAVRHGRVIFDNIKKFLRYLLSSNMGEVLTVFGGVVLAGAIGLDQASHETVVLPLLATQILWVNLITDSAPALAMGVDPEIDDVMSRRPRLLTDRVIDLRMWSGIVQIGAVIAVATLLTIDIFLPGGLVNGTDSLEVARTAGFTTLVLAQLFNTFNSRSETRSAFHHMFLNRWLWAAVVFGLVAQVMVVEVPFLQTAFGTASLDPAHWLVCLCLASTVLWYDELRKLIYRMTHDR